jgi:hypothetical protein
MFEETPKVDFTVKDAEGNVVYRDAIVYSSMAELRADSAAERQAKFQERYDNWVATIEQQSVEEQ